MLTQSDILNYRAKGSLEIEPFNEKQLNPNSYDLRLSEHVAIYTNAALDAAKENQVERFDIPKKTGLLLKPGELYLMSTVESTYTPDFVPGIEGRSSVARLGISIHATAGFGDVGFNGTWTLEVSVIKPVRVYRNMRICQIFFEELSSPVNWEGRYAGKYNEQSLPRPSGIFEEAREWE